MNKCCGQPMEYALLGAATLWRCAYKGMSHGFVSFNGREMTFDELTWYTDEEVDIAAEDLRIDVYRTGINGPISVSDPDTAIRITHIPTGMIEIGYVPETARSQLELKALLVTRLKERLRNA